MTNTGNGPAMVPFSGALSRRGYRLNALLLSFTEAVNREAWAADPEAVMDRHGLTDEERALLRARDWNALLAYGASIYALGKASSVLGTNLVEMGAAMRGQTVPDFMAAQRRERRADMAAVIGGVGCSHAPSLAFAWDSGKHEDAEWSPFFRGFGPVRDWLREARPDLAVVFYNDHLNAFRFDRYPILALGAADLYPVADEGRGRRPLPDLPGDAAFGWHVAETLVAEGFDPLICQEMPVDHGILSCLPMLWQPPWPVPILPIAINVIQGPIPSAARCLALGRAVRKAVEAEPSGRRVVVLGTGGLSHQLHGPDFGRVSPEWDNAFLDQLESDPDALAALPITEYMRRGGAEGVEVIIWLAMRGALGPDVARRHRTYHPGLLTGYGLLALEATPAA